MQQYVLVYHILTIIGSRGIIRAPRVSYGMVATHHFKILLYHIIPYLSYLCVPHLCHILEQYSKAVDFGKLEEAGGKVVTCVFKDDGRVLSVFAKRARGLFARHLVVSRAQSAADLEAFSAEGYRLDRSQCADDVLVFSRSKSQRIPPQPQATTSATNGKQKRAAPASASAAASKKAISSAKASSPNVAHNAARKTKSSKRGRKKS